MLSYQIIISGRVQGVFFRKSAKLKADELSITGWVRNLPTGEVEILAQGNKEILTQFLEWCKIGPDEADVTLVEVSTIPIVSNMNEFEIKR